MTKFRAYLMQCSYTGQLQVNSSVIMTGKNQHKEITIEDTNRATSQGKDFNEKLFNNLEVTLLKIQSSITRKNCNIHKLNEHQ